MSMALPSERPNQPKTPESNKADAPKPVEKQTLTREQIRNALLQRATERATVKNPDAGGQVFYFDPERQKLNTELKALQAMQGESRFKGQEGLEDSKQLAQRIKTIKEQLRDSSKPEKPTIILGKNLAEAAITQRAEETTDAYLGDTNRESLAGAYGIPGGNREVDFAGELAAARKLNKFMAAGIGEDATRVDMPAASEQPAAKPSFLKRFFGGK